MNPLPSAVLEALRTAAGPGNLILDREALEKYASDETEDLVFWPAVAATPTTTAQVSALMRVAHAHNIPVTPRGAGTGLSGGALPVKGGLALSLEKMNRILEIDRANLMAVVEPGVITQVLQEAVEAEGLFYPPDPASRGSCMLGGNVAECAGGPRALKYGVTKDWILGLEAVLADGTVINTGGKLLKNVTGYNLTQLLVGSEGTLAVVTKIILKLIPYPPFRSTLVATFDSLEGAAVALTKIFEARIIPCATEFMESSAIQAAAKKRGRHFPGMEAPATLLIEVDGYDRDVVERDGQRTGEVCLAHGALDVIVADSPTQQKEMWDMRRAIGEAVKGLSIYKEEDTVVPRANLPKLMRALDDIKKRHGLTTICYGHAGDGNIHVNILKMQMSDRDWAEKLPPAIREIFTEVVKLGGTISGEHGIGFVQREWLPLAMTKDEIELMRRVKAAFDPKGLLNPSKLIPE
ncbi:MAG: FAD-binding protein [Planctomycetes bacterium]|nr:FAD-binding protein [Planctomycetota bacterium]